MTQKHWFLIVMRPTSIITSCMALCGVLLPSGCAGLNDGYPGGGYYGGGPYYGGDSWQDRRERDRLRDERERLERERERLERERNRQPVYVPPAYQPPVISQRPPPQYDRCPAGFSPSEQKCSPAERRRGCKDIRLPSGLGCVNR